MIQVEPGDCLEVMARLKAEGVTVQSIVTDPPYHLTNNTKSRSPNPGQYTPIGKPKEPRGGFMGKKWDGGDIAFRPETWRLCYDLLPPGGYLLAFGLPRTFGRMQVAVEDAGFEIRDTICWLFGSGFPKSHDVSKAIDRAAGHWRGQAGTPTRAGESFGQEYARTDKGDPITPAAREWQGWGTALKPAAEFVVMARKPIEGSVAANVLKFGTGAINVGACRVGVTKADTRDVGRRITRNVRGGDDWGMNGEVAQRNVTVVRPDGRWPANVCHDGSPEVMAAFAAFGERQGAQSNGRGAVRGLYNDGIGPAQQEPSFADSGTAARFFKECRFHFSGKAGSDDRFGSRHPTVKPISLMRWLVRMVTPPGGTVLDPFAGSGTTGIACLAEGFDCILIEREEAYLADIRERLAHYSGEGRHSMASKARHKDSGHGDLPLFVK